MNQMNGSAVRESRGTSRMFWLDLARTVAVISITTNHALNRTWSMNAGSVAELQSISLLSTLMKTFFAIFSRIGVPLFLMISGALLLRKSFETEKQIKRFYQHNLLSLLITSEIWYFIMFWFIVFVKPDNTIWETGGLGGALKELLKTVLFIKQTTMDCMWYIPMILSVYTVIPLIAAGLKHTRMGKYLLIPCGIVFLQSMVIPNLNAFFALADIDFSLSFGLKSANVFSMYMLYLLAGYAISNGLMEKVPTWAIVLGAATSFISLCAYQLYAFSREYVYLINYESSGLLICGMFWFELIRRKGDLLKGLERPVTYLSTVSFAIYFIHIVIMEGLRWTMDLSMLCKPVKFLFLELVSFLGSLVVIRLLSRFRVCRQYLFLIKD